MLPVLHSALTGSGRNSDILRPFVEVGGNISRAELQISGRELISPRNMPRCNTACYCSKQPATQQEWRTDCRKGEQHDTTPRHSTETLDRVALDQQDRRVLKKLQLSSVDHSHGNMHGVTFDKDCTYNTRVTNPYISCGCSHQPHTNAFALCVLHIRGSRTRFSRSLRGRDTPAISQS